MALLQGLGGALPGFSLEAAVLAQAELDALAQAAEKGSFIGRRPAEPGRSAIAVYPARAIGEHIHVVLGHGGRAVFAVADAEDGYGLAGGDGESVLQAPDLKK